MQFIIKHRSPEARRPWTVYFINEGKATLWTTADNYKQCKYFIKAYEHHPLAYFITGRRFLGTLHTGWQYFEFDL